MRKKIIPIPMIAILGMVFLVGIGISSTGSTPEIQDNFFMGDGLTKGEMICPTIIRANGDIEEYPCTHNVFTNDGKNWIRNCLGQADCGGATATAFDYMAVGNGSAPGAGSSTLDDEITVCGFYNGANRYQGTYNTVGTGNWSLTYIWTSTCNDQVVNTTALFNATTSGIMLAAGTLSSEVTLQNNDQLNVTYTTWMS